MLAHVCPVHYAVLCRLVGVQFSAFQVGGCSVHCCGGWWVFSEVLFRFVAVLCSSVKVCGVLCSAVKAGGVLCSRSVVVRQVTGWRKLVTIWCRSTTVQQGRNLSSHVYRTVQQGYVRHSTGVCPPQYRGMSATAPPLSTTGGSTVRTQAALLQTSACYWSTVSSAVQCSTVQNSAVHYIAMQCCAVQCSAVQAGLPCPGRQLAEGLALQSVMYSTVQYFTVQYSAVFYSTVQCFTVQCSTVQCVTVLCFQVQSCTAIAVIQVQCNQGILAYIHSYFHKVHIYYVDLLMLRATIVAVT